MSSGTVSKPLSLSDAMKRPTRKVPTFLVIHAVEGFGKTSMAAFSPSPIFLTTETGIETLVSRGRLPETPYLPKANTWRDVLSLVDEIASTKHEFKTLVIDTMNGVEKLMHEHVCSRDFKGNWGESGFGGYQRGAELAANNDWKNFLNRLDKVKDAGIGIIALCHTKVKNFKNPLGPDYDRYEADLHKQSWSLLHKAADDILFGKFEVDVEKVGGEKSNKGKASGGGQRILHTEWAAAYDAKNRYGLPQTIEVSSTGKHSYEGQEAWENLMAAIKETRK